MPALLFVCTANQCRSPIAGAIFNQCRKEMNGLGAWNADSAGTWTKSGLSVNRRSLDLARQVDVDLSGHRTTSVDDLRLSDYDVIVVMEKGQQEALRIENPDMAGRIHLLSALAGTPATDIPDPMLSEEPAAAREILMDMQECVCLIAEKIQKGEIKA